MPSKYVTDPATGERTLMTGHRLHEVGYRVPSAELHREVQNLLDLYDVNQPVRWDAPTIEKLFAGLSNREKASFWKRHRAEINEGIDAVRAYDREQARQNGPGYVKHPKSA